MMALAAIRANQFFQSLSREEIPSDRILLAGYLWGRSTRAQISLKGETILGAHTKHGRLIACSGVKAEDARTVVIAQNRRPLRRRRDRECQFGAKVIQPLGLILRV